MVCQYDATASRVLTAFTFVNTVVPSVLSSLEFWLFFLLHLSFYFAYHNELAPEFFATWTLDWRFVKVISGITTFFQVFYANQCYARYLALYQMSRAVISDVHTFAYLLHIYVKEKCPGHAMLATRYMLAGFLVKFYALSGNCEDTHIASLQSAGFLKPSEVDVLCTHKPAHRHIVILSWASSVARMGMEAADAPAPVHSVVAGSILNLYQKQTDISEMLWLPVPFQYFHLLSIMLVMNLVLWAYGMAVCDSLCAPVVFFFAAFIFTGMMELSTQLADPFGNDEVDFPLEEWLRECVELVVDITETKFRHTKVMVSGAAAQEVPMPHNIHERIRLGGQDHQGSMLSKLFRPGSHGQPPSRPSELNGNAAYQPLSRTGNGAFDMPRLRMDEERPLTTRSACTTPNQTPRQTPRTVSYAPRPALRG